MSPEVESAAKNKTKQQTSRVIIRFAGDSGDGIQSIGGDFTTTTAIFGNDLSTFPDFPAEIRAPAGTLPGVSGFQIQFSSDDIQTPGDRPDVLVAFNPAALKVNLHDMARGTLIIVNEDSFGERDLTKANCTSNPLEDGSLASYKVVRVPITKLTIESLKDSPITHKEKELAKNYFALGVLYWLYSRPLEPTSRAIKAKFGAKKPHLVDSNISVLKAGYNFAETADLFPMQYEVPPAKVEPGTYRNISGNAALALGLVAAGERAGVPIFYGSYPITPASDILHALSKYKNFGVITFQAEDEIAAIASAIGASFTGMIGVTGSSGPGIALKGEAIGLAVMTELPLVIVDIQRGGPSTGLPTKTEQADLFQAIFGRNSESPAAVLAPATPADCFAIAFDAVRFATKYMVPVFILSDGYLANGAEPWKLPKVEDLPKITVKYRTDPNNFLPYERDEKSLGRPWVKPGTPGLEHRIGGIEKTNITGSIDYDPANHDLMVRLRASKVQRIAQDIPEAKVEGPWDAPMLLVGWGGTYGSIRAACEEANHRGMKVAHLHLRHLNPMPGNVGEILKRAGRILIPELNMGQLRMILRARFLVDAIGINKVAGQPFKVSELVEAIEKEYEACRK